MSVAAALLAALGCVSLLIWLHLILGRGLFWLARERDDRDEPRDPSRFPPAAAVVPARDEADVIARSITSLLLQDYPAPFRVILVDDQSQDGTAAQARAAAEALGAGDRLEILEGAPLPAGWTGKLWAVSQGVGRALAAEPRPERLLLTDADIAHAPETLRRLTARSLARGEVLTSLMAKLHCQTPAERALIPAFVFFFDMLYPFGLVSDPKRKIAAAAGGCMLVDPKALERRGGIQAIRAAIIDDCALARLLKPEGPIFLGLTERSRSLRPYPSFASVAKMVSRSAYAELRYSPLRLLGALLGLALTYGAPPALAIFAQGPARLFGLLAFVLMAISYQPMLRFYRRSPAWGLCLPIIAFLYGLFTLRSAVEVWSGRGGLWKGRAQAQMELR